MAKIRTYVEVGLDEFDDDDILEEIETRMDECIFFKRAAIKLVSKRSAPKIEGYKIKTLDDELKHNELLRLFKTKSLSELEQYR